MNKKLLSIIISAAIIILIASVAAFCIVNNKKAEISNETASQTLEQETLAEETFTEKVTSVGIVETLKPTQNKKPNKAPNNGNNAVKESIIIDETLKVLSVLDYGGRLSVTLENISSKDLEYSVLKCTANGTPVTFKITALLSGKKAVAVCNEDIKYEKNIDLKDWSLEDKAFYASRMSIDEKVFKVQTQTGAIKVTNVSDKDIDGKIYICYKKSQHGIYFADETFRVKIENGIKAGETVAVPANRFTQGTHEIIFIDYDN